MYFVNTTFSKKEFAYYFLKIELIDQPDDSPNIFKNSNIECYTERASATFYYGKYSILNDFSNTEFLAYYVHINKSNKTCKYQPVENDDNLIENNHEECSNPTKK